MPYFNQRFIDYFEALSHNNTTAWFDTNRRWYEKEVKLPFQEFIDELIVQLKSIDSDINIEPQDAIFRINNDIRFAKEKIPYKTWMCANISVYGKRAKEYPGFFIQANHEKLVIAGGTYNPDKETLYQIRQHILNDPSGFASSVNYPAFLDRFGGLEGERHKFLQPEFRELISTTPQVLYKQFYFRKEFAAETILVNDLPGFILREFEAAKPLHLFLKKAFKQVLMAA